MHEKEIVNFLAFEFVQIVNTEGLKKRPFPFLRKFLLDFVTVLWYHIPI